MNIPSLVEAQNFYRNHPEQGVMAAWVRRVDHCTTACCFAGRVAPELHKCPTRELQEAALTRVRHYYGLEKDIADELFFRRSLWNEYLSKKFPRIKPNIAWSLIDGEDMANFIELFVSRFGTLNEYSLYLELTGQTNGKEKPQEESFQGDGAATATGVPEPASAGWST